MNILLNLYFQILTQTIDLDTLDPIPAQHEGGRRRPPRHHLNTNVRHLVTQYLTEVQIGLYHVYGYRAAGVQLARLTRVVRGGGLAVAVAAPVRLGTTEDVERPEARAGDALSAGVAAQDDVEVEVVGGGALVDDEVGEEKLDAGEDDSWRTKVNQTSCHALLRWQHLSLSLYRPILGIRLLTTLLILRSEYCIITIIKGALDHMLVSRSHHHVGKSIRNTPVHW